MKEINPIWGFKLTKAVNKRLHNSVLKWSKNKPTNPLICLLKNLFSISSSVHGKDKEWPSLAPDFPIFPCPPSHAELHRSVISCQSFSGTVTLIQYGCRHGTKTKNSIDEDTNDEGNET